VTALFWALFAVALGCALVYRFGNLVEFKPRWAAGMLVFGAGTAAGIGLTSCLFFVSRLSVPGVPKLSLFLEAAILAWLGYEIWRKRNQMSTSGAAPRFPLTLPLMIAGVVALAIATSAMADAWEANPQGNWDAWSIWNLRARFLVAGGALPQRAWSPLIDWTHPEYPLLLSSFVARCWTYAGSTADAAPIATSYLFFLSLISTAAGGLAIWRSRALGLVCGLALLGTPSLLHEVIAQYADIPVACYFAGATMFALLDRPLIAGLFAALAAWTKDEGALFLVVFLVAIAILRREQILLAASGAIPGAAATAVFKIALAPAASAFFRQGAPAIWQRIGDPGRLGQILGAFAHEFGAMSFGWYHPILPVIALAIALRFEIGRRRDLLFTAAILAAMLAGYFGVFLITPNDLKWQLDTSLSRLIVQLWPSLLLIAFAGLRAPEKLAVETPAVPTKARKKTKARHA
jgi:hypothetical protein